MAEETSTMENTQRRAQGLLILVTTALTVVPALAAWMAGNAVLPFLAGSGALAGIAYGSRFMADSTGRMIIAAAMMGQAAMFTAALTGHPWQLDSHMLFFALLATLVILVDLPAVLVATGVVVIHHLSFSILLPGLLYPSTELIANIARTLMHGAIVAIEAAALIYAIRVRQKMYASIVADQAALAERSETAEAMRQKAESALAEAEQSRQASEQAALQAREALETAQAEARRAEEADALAEEARRSDEEHRRRAAEDQNHAVECLRKGLNAMARGDLTVQLTQTLATDYEDLRLDFNRAISQLRQSIEMVLSHAATISNETRDIAASSETLATRTENQAETLAQVSSSMEDLTGLIQSTASGAQESRKTVMAARDYASSSSEVVSQAMTAMTEIETSAQQVQKITSVIDDISFQTNLLALNAGVEAARAGESGRGFAVVASEVRALAQRSSEAAKEINVLISRSNAQVKDGVALVRQTGAALEEILQSVGGISETVDTIADAAEKQASGVGAINGSLKELDAFTQQNAAMFEETSAASHTLSSSIAELRAAIQHFVEVQEATDRQAQTAA